MKRNFISVYEDMISNTVISQHCQTDIWKDINESHLLLLDHFLNNAADIIDITDLSDNYSDELRFILRNQSKERRRCKIMMEFNSIISTQIADRVCTESNYLTLEETPNSWIEESPKREVMISSAELSGIIY